MPFFCVLILLQYVEPLPRLFCNKRLTTETGAEKSTKNFNGGGSCAHKNNIGMYGMQKP